MSNSKKNQDSAVKNRRSLFGRRQGRALRGERADAIKMLMPKIGISENLPENHTITPASLFKQTYSEYWLEIGFGHGERLAQLCKQNTDIAYLGAEPFINGMAAFMKDIQKDNLENIRVLMDDGVILAKSLKPNSLDGLYILNPDPWHKKRHHKRRIINQKNLDTFARILKPNAPLIMSSDVEDLAEWMCTHASNHPAFTWTANKKDDWFSPPADWIPTKYETKGAKGAKKMIYLFFEKQ